MANKIKYGLSNVYYAKATIAADGTATYDTPVAWPGAVNLSLDAEGEQTPFYADNIAYFIAAGNSGYSGDFESALIPESFREDILGEIKDSKDVMFESADAQAVPFALLFQFEGDDEAVRHVLYNCTASRPSVASQTKEDTVTPVTETITITAGAVKNTVAAANVTKARAHKTSAAYAGWFEAVYQGTASA